MTDKELLEMAAKAAGWTGWQSKHGYWNVCSPEGVEDSACHHWNKYCPDTGKRFPEPTFADALLELGWNPLTDDGDALRLLTKLPFRNLYVSEIGATVSWSRDDGTGHGFKCDEYANEHDGDLNAATRRAITRAAAEIGRAMDAKN